MNKCSCGKILIDYRSTQCKSCENKNRAGKKIFTGNHLFGQGYKIKGKNNGMFGKLIHGKRINYKHNYFRSSWEYKFAKWCDKQGIKWLYESKTFDLGNTTYTPDFYLSEFNLYIEVKGWWRDDAKIKFDLFKQRYCGERIKVVDKPELKDNEII